MKRGARPQLLMPTWQQYKARHQAFVAGWPNLVGRSGSGGRFWPVLSPTNYKIVTTLWAGMANHCHQHYLWRPDAEKALGNACMQ
eukprot:1156532-Pelagomonas_calceolata.AAC.6